MDCAGKMDMGDRRLFDSFRKKIRAGIELQTGKTKARAALEALNMLAAWTIYAAPIPGNGELASAEPFEETTIRDIVGKLVRYGSISEGQTAFVNRLLDKIEGRAALAAKRAAEMADAKPVPVSDKRMTVAGIVLSTRVQETQFGMVTKMLVQHADGWKVWGSVPSELGDDLKGKMVRFDARVTVSDKDPKFGFYSRPTKAAIVEAVEVAA
jgi:hypothetical protein